LISFDAAAGGWDFDGPDFRERATAARKGPAGAPARRSQCGAGAPRRPEGWIQTFTQVPGTGQTSSHLAWSKWPSHSVHFLGSITKVSPFIEIAAFGHSNSQRLQPVHDEAMILYVIETLLNCSAFETWRAVRLAVERRQKGSKARASAGMPAFSAAT